MLNIDASKILMPLLTQLMKNEGATIALAKSQLSEFDFEVFLVESEIQTMHSWLEIHKLFPSIFSELDFVDEVNNKIKKLKEEREKLISSKNK